LEGQGQGNKNKNKEKKEKKRKSRTKITKMRRRASMKKGAWKKSGFLKKSIIV
jgi:hypothetical protein